MASLSPLPAPSSSLFTNNRISQPFKISHLLSSSSAFFSPPSKPKIPCELANPVAVPKWRTKVSFFPSFLKNKEKNRNEIKQEVLEAISPLDRGAEVTPEDQERIDQVACKLEALNTIKEPLKSDLLNGKWELLYTTSNSILKSQRPKFLRPNGKIYQAINADTLRAQNMETWPFFNQATADLLPLNSRRVAVKFDTFKIAGLCFQR